MTRRIRKVTSEEREQREREKREKELIACVPRTSLGRLVKEGKVASIDDILAKGIIILEPEIVDLLIPDLEEKVVDFKKTTRVTKQGRNFSFRVSILLGDHQGHLGLGTAKDKERFSAIKKATNRAKLSMIKV